MSEIKIFEEETKSDKDEFSEFSSSSLSFAENNNCSVTPPSAAPRFFSSFTENTANIHESQEDIQAKDISSNVFSENKNVCFDGKEAKNITENNMNNKYTHIDVSISSSLCSVVSSSSTSSSSSSSSSSSASSDFSSHEELKESTCSENNAAPLNLDNQTFNSNYDKDINNSNEHDNNKSICSDKEEIKKRNLEIAEKIAAVYMCQMQQWHLQFSLLCMQHAYYNVEKDIQNFFCKTNTTTSYSTTKSSKNSSKKKMEKYSFMSSAASENKAKKNRKNCRVNNTEAEGGRGDEEDKESKNDDLEEELDEDILSEDIDDEEGVLLSGEETEGDYDTSFSSSSSSSYFSSSDDDFDDSFNFDEDDSSSSFDDDEYDDYNRGKKLTAKAEEENKKKVGEKKRNGYCFTSIRCIGSIS